MKYIFCLFGLVFSQIVNSQSVRVDTLKLYPSPDSRMALDSVFYFPLISSSSPEIDSLINHDLVARYTGEAPGNRSIDVKMNEWIKGSIAYIGFNVSLNRNNLLSIQVISEGCGAYCTGWTEYYNYSTLTGDFLTIDEVIDTSGKLGKDIFNENEIQFANQKEFIRQLQLKDSMALDSSNYSEIIEMYNVCEDSFSAEKFVLEEDLLKIIHECDFPHALKSFGFEVDIRYRYDDIRRFMKPGFQFVE